MVWYLSEGLVNFLYNKIMIIIDIEATCWKDRTFQRDNQETIEIGAVKLNEAKTEIICGFQSLVKPTQNPKLSEFCIRLVGIKQQEVDKAEVFEKVWQEQFIPWCGEDKRFGSWGKFDLEQLKKDCSRLSLEFHFNNFCNIARTCGTRRSAMHSFGVKFEGNRHRGYDDAKNGAILFMKAIESGRDFKFWDV